MSATEIPKLSIEAFEAGAVDAEAFNHKAHVHMAWLYLDRYDLAEAISRFTLALRNLTIHLQVPDKYHETISWIFLLLIAERRSAAATDDWSSFQRDNEDLFCGSGEILRRYYSDELLSSHKAKRSFVLPDRLAH